MQDYCYVGSVQVMEMSALQVTDVASAQCSTIRVRQQVMSLFRSHCILEHMQASGQKSCILWCCTSLSRGGVLPWWCSFMPDWQKQCDGMMAAISIRQGPLKYEEGN